MNVRRQISTGTWSVAAILLLFAGVSEAADAEERPVAYRRIFVPTDRIDAWPRAGDKYIPIEARDFEAWVAAANASNAKSGPAATIDAAEYSATIDDNGRFDGRGKWTISLRDEKPAFLPLDRTALVLRSPRWLNAPKEPVRLGAWGTSDRIADRFGLHVAQTGILEFEWTAPSTAGRDPIEIPWHVPPAISQRLTLDLPDAMEPSISGAAVLESMPLPAARRRWVLATSSTPNAVVRIASRTGEPGQQVVQNADQITLHESTAYRIVQRGVECKFKWDLRDVTGKQRELDVPLPRGLQITSVTSKGRELDWRIARGAASEADRAMIALPTPNDRAALQITVSTWHPLVVDRPWQLPVLRPKGAFWSSGQSELEVAAALELQSLVPLECTQVAADHIGGDSTNPETYSLTAYAPTATVEVTIGLRQPKATLRLGSSLVLTDQDVTGRLATEWSVDRSRVHRLSGELAPGWNVETVETVPAGVLAEWFVDRRGNRRQLEIQLTEAASPTRQITVVVMARLQRFSLAEPIPADTLKMVNWSGSRVAQHLLSFQSSEPFVAEMVGGLPLAAPDSVTDADRALLDVPDDEHRIVDLARAGSGAGLQLTFQRGTYTADVELEATYAGNELRQRYLITAHPQSSAVDRLLIFSTTHLPANTRWIDASTDAQLSAERLSADDPQRKDLPQEGELWLIRLPRPTEEAIEVHTSAAIPSPKRDDLPLIALPGATEQRGRVIVRSTVTAIPSVEPIGLIPIPRPADKRAGNGTDDATLVRTAYRYNPAECLRPLRAPRLSIGPGTRNGTSPLVARELDVETFAWPDGRATHRATYQLENHGTNEFKPILPTTAKLASIAVNGQSLGVPHSAESGNPTSIRLPSNAGVATVTLCFETRHAPLVAGGVVTPPLLQNDIPVLAGEWTFWLPEEFAARTAGRTADSRFSWRRRLFGPFARSSDAPPFRPFQFADWARLVNGIAGWSSSQPREAATLASTDRASSERAASTSAAGTQPEPTDANSRPTTSPPSESTTIIPSGDRLAGWRAFRETFVADGSPAAVEILHPPATTAWAIALLLAAFLLGRWLLRQRGTLLLTLCAFAACLALLLPAVYAPLATGALWGLVFACVADLPRQLLSIDGAEKASRRTAIAGTIVLITACGFTRHGLADPTERPLPDANTAVASKIERVLVPVDSARRPSGSKYYVSERFLRELVDASSEQPTAENQWLLADATYSGELLASRDNADIVAGTFALTFSVETFARSTTIVLPLAREEADWQRTAMLDGVPLPLHWHDTNGSCAIEIAQPGRYSLAIYCVPKTTAANGRGKLRLAVPSLAFATIEIRAPAALTGIAVPGAALASASEAASGVLYGALGPANQLAVEWPRLEPKNGAAQGANVTALSWLHVGPGSTELNTKYIVEGAARRPDSLTIIFDERWKPIADSTPTGKDDLIDASGGRRSLIVPVDATIADRQEVSLRWQLTGAPTIGIYRLPTIELRSFPPSQHWFAMSADPSLDCAVDDNSATSATASEFLAKWGGAPESTPQLVIANFEATREPTLAVRPRGTESTIREVLHVAIQPTAMRVAYQADVSPGTPIQYKFRCLAPPELAVEEVSVTAADHKIPIRWVQDETGHISVFFGKRAASDYRFALAGTIPIAPGEPNRLPRVTTSASTSDAQQLHLYRDDDVQVTLQNLPPPEESSSGPTDLPPVQWLVRPLGIYHVNGDAVAPARATIMANEPLVAGDSLTAIAREAGAWSAAFRCRLAVESGSLDVLRLHVPTGWSGPFDIESSVPVTTELAPLDERRQTLSIRLSTPIAKGNHFDIRLRGPLGTSAGSAASLPDIAFATAVKGRRYAIVPTSLDSQPIAWTEAGVRAADAPKDLLPTPFDDSKQRQLEIVGNPFRVAVNPRASSQVSPQIRLADTSIAAGERGGQLIVTRFILSSDGLSECTLKLPADDELISVKLDGQPALYSLLDAARWRVTLGAADLPQLLEIVSRSKRNDSESLPREFRRPALLAGDRPIPVEVSLWTVVAPYKSAETNADDAARVSLHDQAALRLDRLASIVETASVAAAEAPAPDGDNWLQAWLAIVREVQSQTQQAREQPTAGPAAARVSRTTEEQLDRATQRIEAWMQQMGEQTDGPAATNTSVPLQMAASPWTMPSPGEASVACYVAEGGADRLAVNSVRNDSTLLQSRILPILAIAGLAAIVALLICSPIAADFLCRWPYAFGILLGIGWWAWLSPSWLGLVVVAVSVWLSLRFDWPGRSYRAEASTVLRSTRTH